MLNTSKSQTLTTPSLGRIVRHLGPWIPLMTLLANLMPIVLTMDSHILMLAQFIVALFSLNQLHDIRKTIQQKCLDGTYQHDQPMNQIKRRRICIKSMTMMISGICFSYLVICISNQFSLPWIELINLFIPLLSGITLPLQKLITTLCVFVFGIFLGKRYFHYQRYVLDRKTFAHKQAFAASNNRAGVIQSIHNSLFSNEHLLTRRLAQWCTSFINHFFIITAITLYLSGQPAHLATIGQLWLINHKMGTSVTKIQIMISTFLTGCATYWGNQYKPMNHDYLCHKVAEIARVSWIKELQQFTSETEAEAYARDKSSNEALPYAVIRFDGPN